MLTRVLLLMMKTKKKKCKNSLNFVIFKELLEKLAMLKIAAQVFEAGDFLNIFL